MRSPRFCSVRPGYILRNFPIPFCETALIFVVVGSARSIFPYRYLDALRGKALTQRRRLNHTREFLCTEDMEHVREVGCQNRCVPSVECGSAARRCVSSHVDEVHLESRRRISKDRSYWLWMELRSTQDCKACVDTNGAIRHRLCRT